MHGEILMFSLIGEAYILGWEDFNTGVRGVPVKVCV